MITALQSASSAVDNDVTAITRIQNLIYRSRRFWLIVGLLLLVMVFGGTALTIRKLGEESWYTEYVIGMLVICVFLVIVAFHRNVSPFRLQIFIVSHTTLLLMTGIILLHWILDDEHPELQVTWYVVGALLIAYAVWYIIQFLLILRRNSIRTLTTMHCQLFKFLLALERDRDNFNTIMRQAQRPQERKHRRMSLLYRSFCLIIIAVAILLLLVDGAGVLFRTYAASLLLSDENVVVKLFGIWVQKFFALLPAFAPPLMLAGFLLHRARRHRVALASAIREVDMRPPVLLLRSFADDGLRMPGTRFEWSQFPSLLSRRTVEQFFADIYSSLGPVITVGDPHERLPRLGAARAYFSDLQWRAAVVKLMHEAEKILIMVSSTSHLLWELNTILRKDYLQKTVLIFPPLKQRLVRSRWNALISAIDNQEVRSALAGVGVRDALLICFDDVAHPQIYMGPYRKASSYYCAVALSSEVRSTGSFEANMHRRKRNGYIRIVLAAMIPMLLLGVFAVGTIWKWHAAIHSYRERTLTSYRAGYNKLLTSKLGFQVNADLVPDSSLPKFDDFMVMAALRGDDYLSHDLSARDVYGHGLLDLFQGIYANMYEIVLNADDASLHELAGSTAALLEEMLTRDIAVCTEWLFTSQTDATILYNRASKKWGNYSDSLKAALNSGRQRSGIPRHGIWGPSEIAKGALSPLGTLTESEQKALLGSVEIKKAAKAAGRAYDDAFNRMPMHKKILVLFDELPQYTADEADKISTARSLSAAYDFDEQVLCRSVWKYYQNLSQMPQAVTASIMRDDPLAFTSQ